MFSPILIITLIVTYFIQGRPVFFVQERPGFKEESFKIFKFRTMSEKYDSNNELLPDISRITKLGEILRKTSIDEIPELFNILKGDMSFVGPRPLLKEYLPYYTEEERIRHNVRPGLTGLAQISGRNLLSWDDRLQLDQNYVKNMNFIMDIKILIKTVIKVLMSKDIEVVTSIREKRLSEIRKEKTTL